MSDDRQPLHSQELILGAERTDVYLPFLKGKKVGVVGNQTSIIPTEKGNVHLVDSLLKLKLMFEKSLLPNTVFAVRPMPAKQLKTAKIQKRGFR